MAYFAERLDSYAFYTTDVWIRSLPTFIFAAVTFVALFILAWKNGRTYCNTICPVGTVLGFLSRFSIFKITIDNDKCVSCGLCARKCKAACINSKGHKIDYSRCVDCMDCIEACTHDAIGYRLRAKKSTGAPKAAENKKEQPAIADTARRAFMTASVMIAGSSLLRSQEKKVDGGLAVILDKKAPKRTTPIVPPGAISLKNIAEHCTGCQLCVSACPNNVLRPSSNLLTLMQPESSYERGYCRPECTRCSQVCPAGAIVKISRAEKSSIQIGRAVWIKDNCLPVLYGTECGNCARHCPSGAIQMVNMDPNNPESPKIPVVNTERCIGCGACENLCPARPFSAIYVEGTEVHRTI